MATALEAAGALLQDRRDLARRRQRIIAANAELRERELAKLASWSVALAETLCRRGLDERAASLTAEVAMAVFRIGFARWIEEGNERELPAILRESFDQLKAVTAGR